MTNQYYHTGAQIVLSNEVVSDASLLIDQGFIQSINSSHVNGAIEIDLSGKTLLPGMIDLHCDALEKEVEPRPNVHFPLDFAIAQADKRNAAAGVTTIFHALSFANEELGVRNNEFAAEIVRSVNQWQRNALVDNRVHCRYEVTDESGLEQLMSLLNDKSMHLLSLMDHTPGQGQFKDLAAYRDYLSRTYKTSDEKLDEIVDRKQLAASGAMSRVEKLIKCAQKNKISVASHDDDNQQRVDTMHGLGVTISEFPIDLDTAKYAQDKGLKTIVGAPNILRGKSQSGSMRAVDAINAGVADCLCADYSPAALLAAVFKLPSITDLSLPDAINLVSLNPANAVGLLDRGEISVGKRADLVAVAHFGDLAQASHTWSAGKLVYQTSYGNE